MITISQGMVRTCTVVSRRDFLRVGGVGLGSLGLSLADLNALPTDQDQRDRAVILLMLVGGPSQLEVPHGQSAGWLSAAYEPFHLASDPASPGWNSRSTLDRARRFLDRAASQWGTPGEALTNAANPLLDRSMTTAFQLAEERDALRDAYGRNTFGQSCLLARRLVEAGVRLVTVNMFETVFNKVTWDCHGTAPFSTLDDYSGHLLPTLDQAVSTLLDDLGARGLLDSTMVVANGEFGRTPNLNAAGGRDHWPGVWSALLAGGGVCGGQVIGAQRSSRRGPRKPTSIATGIARPHVPQPGNLARPIHANRRGRVTRPCRGRAADRGAVFLRAARSDIPFGSGARLLIRPTARRGFRRPWA